MYLGTEGGRERIIFGLMPDLRFYLAVRFRGKYHRATF